VPGYAATENFGYLRAQFPDYSYKEATLNPTNPRDRAVDWEADIVNAFRNQPNLKEYSGERESATGPALFFGATASRRRSLPRMPQHSRCCPSRDARALRIQ